MRGFLLLDKEKGITSFDLVRRARKILGVRKIGHSGTLDPLATGLMVLAVGEATKLLSELIGLDKVYEVEAVFGYKSDTFDAQGEVTPVDLSKKIEQAELEDVLVSKFTGRISQVPPKYSALKVGGKRACDLTRAGVEVEMRAREVEVFSAEIVGYDWPEVRIRFHVSSGTYIRSLVHDLGEEVTVGAFVKELRREKIGPMSLDDALKLEESLGIEQKMYSLEEFVGRFFSEKELVSFTEEEKELLLGGRTVLGKKLEQEVGFGLFDGCFFALVENFEGGVKMRRVLR